MRTRSRRRTAQHSISKLLPLLGCPPRGCDSTERKSMSSCCLLLSLPNEYRIAVHPSSRSSQPTYEKLPRLTTPTPETFGQSHQSGSRKKERNVSPSEDTNTLLPKNTIHHPSLPNAPPRSNQTMMTPTTLSSHLPLLQVIPPSHLPDDK